MPNEDKSGRRGLSRNVLGSWFSYAVFIVFGFVMPRVIDDSIGQVGLGIWDFSWSVVSYLNLAMMGIGSSVNRYVARYRAAGDLTSLSAIVSTVNAIQIGIGCAVLFATYVVGSEVPPRLADQLGDQTETAAIVIYLLGTSTAVRMSFDVYRGVMTGYHRWTTHNALNAASYALSAIAMIVWLLRGGGLVGMAGAYLGVTTLTELFRMAIVRYTCRDVAFRWGAISKKYMKKVFSFGIKTILLAMPRVVLLQTVNVLVIATLGPATLAILSRPVALVNHVATLVNKFAFVLVPTAGALQVAGSTDELKDFAIGTMRAGWFFAILPLSYLGVFGDSIIELWMGPDYVDTKVMLILVGASLFTVSQRSLATILVGMNRHGVVAKYTLIFIAAIFIVSLAVIQYQGWTLVGAACLFAVPNVIGFGLVTMVTGCDILGITAKQYFRDVLLEPIGLLSASIPAMLVARELGPSGVIQSLLVGALVLCMVSLIVLRNYVKPIIASIGTK